MVRWLSCSPIQSIIYADLDTRVWGRLVPRVCCVTLSLPPPLIQWDTPRRPLWCLQFIVVRTPFLTCFSTTSVLRGLRRRQKMRRPHKLFSELVGGFSSVETDRQLDTKQFGEWKTNEQERKFCGVENHFYWDSRLAGGRRILKTTKRQFWLRKILSGILWVREYCRGAGQLTADCPLKTSATKTVQERAQLRAALVKKQF